MDYKELIERLRHYADFYNKTFNGLSGASIEYEQAADALTAVMEENAQLRAKILDLEAQHRTEFCESALYDCVELGKVRAELEHKNEVVERYAASARSIALYLKEFCNKSLPYDEMISDAARKAEAELEQVKRERDALKNELCYKCGNYEQAHNGWCDHCRWKEAGIDDAGTVLEG